MSETHVIGYVDSRPTVQRCQLGVIRGPLPGQGFELGSKVTRAGKGEDNDVVIPDVTVSRNHFEIIREGDEFTLRDLESTNGTYIDESRVKEAYLRPGAR